MAFTQRRQRHSEAKDTRIGLGYRNITSYLTLNVLPNGETEAKPLPLTFELPVSITRLDVHEVYDKGLVS